MQTALFYQLYSSDCEQILPRLLEKSLEQGWYCVVKIASEERVELIDNILWTYKDESFLPHGTYKDKCVEMMPIYLTIYDERPNKADVLFVVDEADVGEITLYKRYNVIFDAHNKSALQKARKQWLYFKSWPECELKYWRQNRAGKWLLVK